jgi:predicted DCC family thiol-disulfide oxidoreductase YuxK
LAEVIVFDGVCNLCSASVRFIIARDPAARFRFAALQSEAAKRLLASVPHPDPLPDAIVLVDGSRAFTRSTAALRIARRLTFPWLLLYAFIFVPRVIRDAVYDLIAARRYRWFGKRDECMVPTPDLRARFLDIG